MTALIPERLIEVRKSAGLSQSELARRVGIGQSSINRLEAGDTLNPRNIIKIARELGTTPEYLVGETDDPSPPSDLREASRGFAGVPPELASPAMIDELVQVREIDLKFGMGATELEVPVTTRMRHFDRAFLRQYTHANPDHLYFAQGIGDSMEPTIKDSDLLLIDTSERDIRMSDKFWAIAFGNSGMVKRLRPMPDGAVKIISDNPSVPDEIAHDGEMHVLGRVAGIVRKM